MCVSPSPELRKVARAALILRDETLSSYARKLGIAPQNLSKALSGDWRGPRATALVKQVATELGLTE